MNLQKEIFSANFISTTQHDIQELKEKEIVNADRSEVTNIRLETLNERYFSELKTLSDRFNVMALTMSHFSTQLSLHTTHSGRKRSKIIK